jgi:uncharacterized membrane protein YjjP (DUF1212 family)
MEPDRQRLEQDVTAAVELGVVVLQNGGSTRAADRTLRKVLRGRGHERVTATWRLDCVAARSMIDGCPVTVVRPIGRHAVNLHRVSEALQLGDRASREAVDPAFLASETSRIGALAPYYSNWIVLAAAALSAIGFARLCGVNWSAAAFAGLATTAGRSAGLLLEGYKAPALVVTLLSGIVSASIAFATLRRGLPGAGPGTLVASIVYLMPGLPLITGFVDMLSDRYLMAGLERITNALLLSIILALAVELAVGVAL